MPIRVGVLGAGQRMGIAVCRAVASDPALELVAAIDPTVAGADLVELAGLAAEGPGLRVASDVDELHRCDAAVAVDLTRAAPDATQAELAAIADHGVHAVIGADVVTHEDVARLRDAFVRSNCVIASNFSIAAVLMMRFAEMAAPYFQYAEIVERQPITTAVAPSRLAIELAERMARAEWKGAPPPELPSETPGAEGAAGAGDIPLHSVRIDGTSSRHELILGTTGQQVLICHESQDQTMQVPGLLLALKRVPDTPGVTVGLDALLGLR
jgi:4-hydroxy-tetrahydrodipicolinate reductase